jgi:flagellar hook assembly protein FlgD
VLRFALNKRAWVVVRVRNTRGRVVRRAVLGPRETGSWGWNGRSDAGNLVSPGRYELVLEARALGELRRALREVAVARP